MNVENAVVPTAEQFQTLLSSEYEGPVCMLNLLKFKVWAEYDDGRDEVISGREAYGRYAEKMQKLVESKGGRFLFGGEVKGLVLGEVEELWDSVGIVEYPSREEFVAIASSLEVQELGIDRKAGLDGQLLIPMVSR